MGTGNSSLYDRPGGMVTEMNETKGNNTKEFEKRTENRLRKHKSIYNLSREIDKVYKMVRELTGLGDFTEKLVRSSIPTVFKEKGIFIYDISSREGHYNGETMEIDILALGKMEDNLKVALIIEIEDRLSSESIEKLTKKIEKFPTFFEEYKDYQIIGVLAGEKYPKKIMKAIERSGVYVLVPADNIMRIANSVKFKPKIFNKR